MKMLHLRRILVPLFLIALWQTLAGQESKPRSTCAGLHAGITAEFAPGYTEPSVMVAFVLLNDAETSGNAAPGSWKLVIDGKELEDSGFLFGNGPMPTGGYGTLAPGATFNFSKALPVAKYFPEKREYTVSWRGKDFQSPTIIFLPMYRGHNSSTTK